jgi:two-component system chemotaxis sensor kinase CheA
VDEITEEFLLESLEAVDQLDRDLVSLEAAPSEKEVLSRIFRALHTIKGTCGFLGFTILERVTHAGESLLSRLRDGELAFNEEIASALLGTVDAIRAMLESIQTQEKDGDEEYVALVATLKRLVEQPPAKLLSIVPALATSAKKTPKKRARTAVRLAVLAPPEEEPQPLEPVQAPEHALPERSEPTTAVHSAPKNAPAETVRIDVHLLDRLMDLAGELVLTRNQVREIQLGADNAALSTASQRLNLVTTGLQEGIMLMRMQPVEYLFGKFPRMVRDIAKQCGKLARVELSGNDAELDRTLLEAIKDPLTHLIRNAVDHGIEPPEARLAKGKAAEGVVCVRAVHQSGHVSIEISDDGAGIPLDRVRDKAIAKGLLSQERANQLSPSECANLIFLPGLSTANAVTNVSGRGVGMDVVKTNVERLGGTVEVETELGKGSSFRLKLPLTLAIIPALIVESAGERYAIPQVHLQELVLLDRSKQKLETVYDAPVFRLRDRLLPIVFLGECLAQANRSECSLRPKSHLAVLQVNGLLFGLAVDRVIDQQEIVVKPLSALLQNIPLYSACTILGDGRVVLILDAAGIAQRSHLTTTQAGAYTVDAARDPQQRANGPVSSFLLISEGTGPRLALPLEGVTRLETVPRSHIEQSGESEVLQYQGEIIPLHRLGALLPVPRAESTDAAGQPLDYANVVIVANGRGSVGIMVSDVIDVVDLESIPQNPVNTAGVLGSMVVNDRVTDVLSIAWLLDRAGCADPNLLRSA